MEDEQFDVLPSGTYVRGFLRTYADYLGLDGQLYVDEYSSRFGDLPEVRVRRRATPPQRRNESSNAVLIALAGIVAVGVLLLAAWKLNPSSDRPTTPIPPPDTTKTSVPTGANPAGLPVVKAQTQEKKQQANRADLTPEAHPVWMRIDIDAGKSSYLVVRRLSDLTHPIFENILSSPNHLGGKVQKDPKGYLIMAACNPVALTLTVNGRMYTLDPANTGPYKVTWKGLVPTRAPAGVPSGLC